MILEKERLGYVSLHELAPRMGVNYNTLYARMARRQFPEPTKVLPGAKRRYYGPDDLAEMRRIWGKPE